LIVATIPAGIVGKVFHERIEATFKSLLFVGVASSSRGSCCGRRVASRETARCRRGAPRWASASRSPSRCPWHLAFRVNGERCTVGESSLR